MTLEALNKRIKTTADLRDIVSTMKMLSSVSIGQYEKALSSLTEYGKTVREAFQGLFKDDEFMYTPRAMKTERPKTVAIIIGSDNGLVGRFNRDVMTFAREEIAKQSDVATTQVICVGKRIGLMAESAHMKVSATYPIMNSLKEIASVASMVLMKINEIVTKQRIDRVMVYNTYRKSGEPQRPVGRQLMPLPHEELIRLKKEKWDGRTLPLVTGDRQALFSALIHEYLMVILAHALTASLAAEHYTRMVNMQQAEKNIDESLERMNLEYQQLRQTSITDELIDIVSAAESMKKKKTSQNPLRELDKGEKKE